MSEIVNSPAEDARLHQLYQGSEKQEHSRYFAPDLNMQHSRAQRALRETHSTVEITTEKQPGERIKKKRYKKESRKMHTFEGRESTKSNAETQRSRK